MLIYDTYVHEQQLMSTHTVKSDLGIPDHPWFLANEYDYDGWSKRLHVL